MITNWLPFWPKVKRTVSKYGRPFQIWSPSIYVNISLKHRKQPEAEVFVDFIANEWQRYHNSVFINYVRILRFSLLPFRFNKKPFKDSNDLERKLYQSKEIFLDDRFNKKDFPFPRIIKDIPIRKQKVRYFFSNFQAVIIELCLVLAGVLNLRLKKIN